MSYPRLTPEEVSERCEARSDEFKAGLISEPVYRASLFALGLRGDAIAMEVRRNWPEKKCAR